MALDDFMDIDSNSSENNTDSNTNSSDSELLDLSSFKEVDGEPERKGPLGYPSHEAYRETITDDIDIDTSLIKTEMPVFPHITDFSILDNASEPSSLFGKRFEVKQTQEVVGCLGYTISSIENTPRELLMIDTGKTAESECISVIEDRIGGDLDLKDQVVILFLGNTRHLGKLAMGDEEVDSIGSISRETVLSAVFKESYTHRLAKRSNSDVDHLDPRHIDEWDR